jgi:hypothetical protein
LCNEVYGLFRGKAEYTNYEGRTSSANNPNEYKNKNCASAEGKYEHTDPNVIRNIEIQCLTLKNERGTDREAHFR